MTTLLAAAESVTAFYQVYLYLAAQCFIFIPVVFQLVSVSPPREEALFSEPWETAMLPTVSQSFQCHLQAEWQDTSPTAATRVLAHMYSTSKPIRDTENQPWALFSFCLMPNGSGRSTGCFQNATSNFKAKLCGDPLETTVLSWSALNKQSGLCVISLLHQILALKCCLAMVTCIFLSWSLLLLPPWLRSCLLGSTSFSFELLASFNLHQIFV